MPLILCLAEAQIAPTRKKAVKKSDTSNSELGAEKQRTFTILERLPVRFASNRPVWDFLISKGSRQLIIDDESPSDAFMATVIPLDLFSVKETEELNLVLGALRDKLLREEHSYCQNSPLAKDLDALYSELKEWIMIRGLLVNAALRAPPTNGASVKVQKKKKKRALLLIKS